MYHNRTAFIINNMNKFNHNLDYSEYCNSVIDCTDYEGNLSEPKLHKLLHDHGANYYEYATDCGMHDYHASHIVLTWLDY